MFTLTNFTFFFLNIALIIYMLYKSISWIWSPYPEYFRISQCLNIALRCVLVWWCIISNMFVSSYYRMSFNRHIVLILGVTCRFICTLFSLCILLTIHILNHVMLGVDIGIDANGFHGPGFPGSPLPSSIHLP